MSLNYQEFYTSCKEDWKVVRMKNRNTTTNYWRIWNVLSERIPKEFINTFIPELKWKMTGKCILTLRLVWRCWKLQEREADQSLEWWDFCQVVLLGIQKLLQDFLWSYVALNDLNLRYTPVGLVNWQFRSWTWFSIFRSQRIWKLIWWMDK